MIISPFGSVRFRDFFFTDVVTSIGSALVDIGLIWVYFIDGNWKDKEPVSKTQNVSIEVYIIVVSFLPYWWRFWQCMRKFYLQNNSLQAVNAMKYVSKFGPAIAKAYGVSKHFGEDTTFWAYFGT